MLNRSTIFLLIFLVTIAVVPMAIIVPSVRQIKNTGAAIYQEYAYLEDRHQRGKHVKNAVAAYNEYLARVTELRSVALEPDEELSFIVLVEELAASNGIEQVLQLLPHEAEVSARYRTLPFTVSVRGNYENVMTFISELEYGSVTVTIDAIQVNSDTDNGIVDAQLRGDVYMHTTSHQL